jgi:hypothetical protein
VEEAVRGAVKVTRARDLAAARALIAELTKRLLEGPPRR